MALAFASCIVMIPSFFLSVMRYFSGRLFLLLPLLLLFFEPALFCFLIYTCPPQHFLGLYCPSDGNAAVLVD